MPLERCVSGLMIASIVFGNGAWAQAPKDRPASPPSDELIGREAFSLEDGKAINFHRGWRDIGVAESCRLLGERAAGTLHDPDGSQTGTAIRLLRMLRPSGQNVADLLCKNLTYVPEIVHRAHWTELYPAAMALIQIGGPQVANSVINYLKDPRSDVELQLCAQILYRNDSREITFLRFRLATEEAKLKMEPAERELFERHLSQIRDWMNDPRFEHDPRLLPALRLSR